MILNILLIVLSAVCATVVYIYYYMFIHGAQNKGTKHDLWIREVCFGSSSISESIRSIGFFKASFREFLRYYRVTMGLVPSVKLGQCALDAALVTLDGKPINLSDYIKAMPSNVPLVLNMGSYT